MHALSAIVEADEIDRRGRGGGVGVSKARRGVLAKRYGWIHCFNYAGRHALG